MKIAWRWVVVCLGMVAPASAQDWTTLGNDAQRSGWLRSSAKISTKSVQTPEFQLLWKRDFDAETRGSNSVSAPVLLDFLISHKGFRSLAFLGAADGSVFAVDTDLDRPEWERRFGAGAQYPAATADCPGGMTSSLTRPTVAALPALGGFSGSGRRSAGFSGVGKPNEGAVTLQQERSPGFRRPEPPKPGARVQAPARRVLSGLSVVYALTADGLLHTMLVSNGYDHGSPIPFLPANANAKGLMVVDGTAYAATSGGCNGVPNGVWAADTESGKVSSWKAGAGSVAGMAGYAVAPDGTVYAATDDGRVVALAGGTLAEKGVHKGSGGYVSSPVVIDYQDQDFLVVARKDGSVALFEASKLGGGPVSATPADSAGFASDALATWRDAQNVTWVLAPKAGAVEAFKIVESSGKPTLESGWKAQVKSPLPPIVVDNIVFVSTGGGTAVLHALDGATGKPLWTSGSAVKAPAAKTGLTAGPNTIYLATNDGALYAFGFPIEH